MNATTIKMHGVAVAAALDHDGPLVGALLLGPSGSGKSALALSLIEACPFGRTALVADDVALVETRGGAVWARAPEQIAGLIEVRGFGPVRVRARREARLLAAFDLAAVAERLPEPAMKAFGEGVFAPLWPFAPGGDAPARLRASLRSILGGQMSSSEHHSESPLQQDASA